MIRLALISFAIVTAASLARAGTNQGSHRNRDRAGFFQHRRLGRGGRIFWMFKFRTMIDGADLILSKLLDSDPEARQEFVDNLKLKNDPRITWLGAFLRRSSLDELPLMFNVIKGDISWVGPRPIVPPEAEKYAIMRRRCCA